MLLYHVYCFLCIAYLYCISCILANEIKQVNVCVLSVCENFMLSVTGMFVDK